MKKIKIILILVVGFGIVFLGYIIYVDVVENNN